MTKEAIQKILTNITSTEICLDKTRESIEALLKEIASVDLSEHMRIVEEWISPMVGQLLASQSGLWLVYEYPELRQAISLPMLQEKPFADSDETLFYRVVCHRVGFRLICEALGPALRGITGSMLCDVPANKSFSAWFAITAEMDNHDFLRYVQGWLAISQVTESAMSDRVTYRGKDNQSALLNLCRTGQGISLLENDGLINKVTAEALNRYCIDIDRYFDTDFSESVPVIKERKRYISPAILLLEMRSQCRVNPWARLSRLWELLSETTLNSKCNNNRTFFHNMVLSEDCVYAMLEKFQMLSKVSAETLSEIYQIDEDEPETPIGLLACHEVGPELLYLNPDLLHKASPEALALGITRGKEKDGMNVFYYLMTDKTGYGLKIIEKNPGLIDKITDETLASMPDQSEYAYISLRHYINSPGMRSRLAVELTGRKILEKVNSLILRHREHALDLEDDIAEKILELDRSNLICPITGDVMRNPVTISTSTHRGAIEYEEAFWWLELNRTCPITKRTLLTEEMSPDDIITPDTERRLQIAELASANNAASLMGLFSDVLSNSNQHNAEKRPRS